MFQAYIPTNVISITDGQILETEMFNADLDLLSMDFSIKSRRFRTDKAMKKIRPIRVELAV